MATGYDPGFSSPIASRRYFIPTVVLSSSKQTEPPPRIDKRTNISPPHDAPWRTDTYDGVLYHVVPNTLVIGPGGLQH